jgi:UDP-N-acetylbacillosamine N-acetyltransferase
MAKDINSKERKESIVIFGYRDTMVGLLIECMNIDEKYTIEYFVSVNPLPNLDIEAEHKKRPNSKTEFVVDHRIYGKPVYVGLDYLKKIKREGIKKVAVFEDDKDTRHFIFSSLKNTGIEILSFIHPSVFLGGKNDFGTGVIIFPNCYIGYKSDIGEGTVIQSGCTIEHHNRVGAFTHINPSLTTGGFTRIGDFVEISMSVDIINRINVENGAKIGAGSLVLKDCEKDTLYYGRPAKPVRKIQVV